METPVVTAAHIEAVQPGVYKITCVVPVGSKSRDQLNVDYVANDGSSRRVVAASQTASESASPSTSITESKSSQILYRYNHDLRVTMNMMTVLLNISPS